MKVREIVSHRVHSISSSAMVSEAFERMKTFEVDALPVVENHQIVGIVAEKEIDFKTLPADSTPQRIPIRSVMTSGVACCSQEDEIDKAKGLLEASPVHRLIVLDSQGEAVGVLSAKDMAS